MCLGPPCVQLMGVEGLTRENVASHLQKFRLQQKRDNRLDAEGNLLAPPSRPEGAGGANPIVGASAGTGTGESGPHSAEEADQAPARGSSPDQLVSQPFSSPDKGWAPTGPKK